MRDMPPRVAALRKKESAQISAFRASILFMHTVRSSAKTTELFALSIAQSDAMGIRGLGLP